MHNIDKEIDMTSQICVVCSYFLNNEGDLDFHVNKLIGFLVQFFLVGGMEQFRRKDPLKFYKVWDLGWLFEGVQIARIFIYLFVDREVRVYFIDI